MRNMALKTVSGNLNEALTTFLRGLLEKGVVEALLVPQAVPSGTVVVQTLVRNPDALTAPRPLAPLAMQNSARLVSRLTAVNPGVKIGVVLRSCETRALIELVKLNQATLDNVLIIGIDCLGTFEPANYRTLVEQGDFKPAEWLMEAARGNTAVDNIDIRPACSMCGHVNAEHADIHIGCVGLDQQDMLLVQATDDALVETMAQLGLAETEVPPAREEALSTLVAAREGQYRCQVASFSDATGSLEQIANLFASCLNCHNCRQVCPVCICQECVFAGPLFKHQPGDYLGWAERKGVIEMPTDTLLFHLTRVNHIGLSCVGCGHCESACPAGLPLTLLFKTAGEKVREIFAYEPGRSVDEELPLATYEVSELEPR